MDYVLCATFIIVLVTVEYVGYKKYNDIAKRLNEMTAYAQVKEELHNAERQQLLDRIQSPTFAEYKQQEVKVIKAKNGTDKPDIVIEQL